jgi:hypothetical protein
MIYDTLADALRDSKAAGKKRNKYNVSPSTARTWRGRVYDSKAEMHYAQGLHAAMEAGHGTEIIEQPAVRLGEDTVYRPDFLVIELATAQAYYVDVKGAETKEWRKNVKLWRKYGRLPLHVVKKGKTVEVIEGGQER